MQELEFKGGGGGHVKEPSAAVPCCYATSAVELYIHVKECHVHRGLICCATPLARLDNYHSQRPGEFQAKLLALEDSQQKLLSNYFQNMFLTSSAQVMILEFSDGPFLTGKEPDVWVK